jgi:hypothetical protein
LDTADPTLDVDVDLQDRHHRERPLESGLELLG